MVDMATERSCSEELGKVSILVTSWLKWMDAFSTTGLAMSSSILR